MNVLNVNPGCCISMEVGSEHEEIDCSSATYLRCENGLRMIQMSTLNIFVCFHARFRWQYNEATFRTLNMSVRIILPSPQRCQTRLSSNLSLMTRERDMPFHALTHELLGITLATLQTRDNENKVPQREPTFY